MSLLTEYEWASWAFGGIGITIVTYVGKKIFGSKKVNPTPPDNSNSNSNSNNISVNLYTPEQAFNATQAQEGEQMNSSTSIEIKKSTTKILFIDDEVKFKVVKILQNAGWKHTQLIKDVKSLDQTEVVESKIIFVDIQGVGIELDFKEEGLGLASALKEKYPQKTIIIYSAEQKGDRFHKTLRQVDDSLAKDADPYQFQSLVEDYA
ncbi:hypothetical protein D3C77_272720 [compost metagenome]